MSDRRFNMAIMSIPTIISCAFLAIALPKMNYERALRNKLFSKVEIIADTNEDSSIDNSEWSKVYEILGLKYDAHNSNPRKDLSLNQLEQYLARF